MCSLRYLRNVDQPRTPNLEPIQTATEEDSVSVAASGVGRLTTQQLGNNPGVVSSDGKVSQRSQSLESRFECYENNNNATFCGKTNGNSLQLSTKAANKLMSRKLPALEVKGNSINIKGKLKK